MDNIIAVLAGLSVICALYAWGLEQLKRAYEPDWTWATVVVGNSLIGLAVAALCALDELPWRAAWLFAACNCAAGVPVIAWQLWQRQQRRRQRVERGRAVLAQRARRRGQRRGQRRQLALRGRRGRSWRS